MDIIYEDVGLRGGSYWKQTKESMVFTWGCLIGRNREKKILTWGCLVGFVLLRFLSTKKGLLALVFMVCLIS